MMVANPEDQLAPLAEAGADALIFHIEASQAPGPLLERTRALGCAAGVAISPDTPAADVEGLLDALDEVVVMTVYPGRGGQQLLAQHLDKVRHLRRCVEEAGLEVALEVDGGVKASNAANCIAAGADVLVAGSAVYNDRETPRQALAALRRAVAEVEPQTR